MTAPVHGFGPPPPPPAPAPAPAGSGLPLPFPQRLSPGRVLLAALAAGIVVDLALRSGAASLASALAVAVLAIGLVTAGRARVPWSVALCVAAVATGAWVAVRVSPWLVAVDLVAAGLLLVAATSIRSGDSLFDLSFPDVARRLARGPLYLLVAPAFAGEAWVLSVQRRRRRRSTAPAASRGSDGLRRHGPAAARGAVLGLPLVVVLVLLLASADAVFASFFRIELPSLPLATGIGHVLLITAGGWLSASLLAGASGKVRPMPPAVRPLGAVEAAVVAAGLTAVYALFAVAQVVVALGGADHVLATQGLTSAEYARSGFFQLLWAAGITFVALLSLRAATRRDGGHGPAATVARGCSVATALLTLVVVGTAIRRLGVYQEAYGLTMLRLACTVFAWWLGAVFVLVAARLAGLGGTRRWLPGAVVATALVAVMTWNAMGPEAMTVRANIDHAAATGRFDPDYFGHLSDDAVPALVGAFDDLGPADRAAVAAILCRDDRQGEDPTGWAAWNRSRAEARTARARVCPA